MLYVLTCLFLMDLHAKQSLQQFIPKNEQYLQFQSDGQLTLYVFESRYSGF